MKKPFQATEYQATKGLSPQDLGNIKKSPRIAKDYLLLWQSFQASAQGGEQDSQACLWGKYKELSLGKPGWVELVGQQWGGDSHAEGTPENCGGSSLSTQQNMDQLKPGRKLIEVWGNNIQKAFVQSQE
jgi:hypothetical protein